MSKKIKILFAFLVFWVALLVAWEWWQSYPKVRFSPPLNTTSQNEGLDSILNQAMSTYLLPGISLAIVKNGKVTYLNAFGYENLDTKDPLTVESKIVVASVSKLFTALGLAIIQEEKGHLPNTPLNSMGMGIKVNSSNTSNLRPQDILSHESRIRDKNFSEKIFSFSNSQDLYEWGEEFLDKPSTYDSDSIVYSYADANFDLLGYLISVSAKMDFDSLMKSKVLIPSGMLNSEFITSWPIEDNKITGYQKTFLWKRIEPKRISFPILPSPSSGLITTPKDMSLALIHLLRGEMGFFQKSLNWLTPEGESAPLGFQRTQINGDEWIGHFGGQAGYSSLLFYSKKADTGIFLFANSRDKEDFRIEIARQAILYISP